MVPSELDHNRRIIEGENAALVSHVIEPQLALYREQIITNLVEPCKTRQIPKYEWLLVQLGKLALMQELMTDLNTTAQRGRVSRSK